ncbi:MAG TPA: hypothetical protein VKE27_10850 [Candidatus Dormibacteraeota bacterium]|nr:hypothetical protein [Candidatus Dormibacteraeota bacterium]
MAGLADGARVLAIAGGFWFALAAWSFSSLVLVWTIVPILIVVGLLVWKSRNLRQTSSFTRDQAINAPRGTATWKIRVAFSIVGTAETVGVIAAGSICFALHRLDVLWPWIGAIVSLHLIPLGWIFNLRAYYLVGMGGAVLSLAAILLLNGSAVLIAAGAGLGLIFTLCAAYMLTRSEALLPRGAA